MATDILKQEKSVFGRVSTEDLRKQSSELEAAAALKILFGCWPNANPHDPDIYRKALLAVFQKYPPVALARVCDPVCGLPSKCSFLPTIAEVIGELEDEMRPLVDERREKERLKLLQNATHFRPNEEEKARIAALTALLFTTMGKEFELEEGESGNIYDHTDSNGLVSYASAMKCKLKPTGYARVR